MGHTLRLCLYDASSSGHEAFESAFKQLDGVMVATRTRQTIGDIQEVVTTITDVSFESVESGAFDLPESIQELLKSG